MAKKILTAAMALAISFALWLYVVMVIGPEYQDTFRGVKVELVGQEVLKQRGLMVMQDVEDLTVDLVLSGNRSDLNKLSSSNISVTLDVSRINGPADTPFDYDISFPGNVAQNAVTVESQNPSGFALNVVWTADATIPVNVYFDPEMVAEGYGALPQEQELTQISIFGPRDVVGRIKEARIELELEQDTKSDVSGEYVVTLCDENGQEVDARYVTVTPNTADTIDVTLPIRMKKVLPLTVEVIEGGGATKDNTVVTLEYADITVLGTEEALKDLTQLNLGTIDLGQIEAGDEPIKLPVNLPSGVTNRSGFTEVTVTVELPELVTKEFVINRENIQLLNVPAGMKIEISEVQLTIRVRGTKNAVNALTEEMLAASLDLSEAKIGLMKDWPVTVTISGEPDGVGVVGWPYTVWIEVKDASKSAE